MGDKFKIAKLDEGAAAKIQALEAEIGVHLMAYEPGEMLANLDDSQLEAVRKLECELGVTVVAYSG